MHVVHPSLFGFLMDPQSQKILIYLFGVLAVAVLGALFGRWSYGPEDQNDGFPSLERHPRKGRDR